MLIVRPVRFSDLPQIEQLAMSGGSSLTTLPNNRDHLAQLINNTQQSLLSSAQTSITGHSFHFVLEDNQSQDIIGISGIESCVGHQIPFYSYRCDEIQHFSQELQIENTVATLSLSQDHEDASRLYTFLLADKSAEHYALPLLSLARLMFIAQRRELFAQKIIVELQGVVNEDNQSPFWQALGQHFFNMDFHRANYLTGINAKGFIADLMPRHPIYTPLLAASAQQAIGCVRPDMQIVEALLKDQGFAPQGYISIFDGGPTLESQTDDIAALKQLFITQLHQADYPSDQPLQDVLICNTDSVNFRCIHSSVDLSCIYLNAKQCQSLKVDDGDSVYVLPLQIHH